MLLICDSGIAEYFPAAARTALPRETAPNQRRFRGAGAFSRGAPCLTSSPRTHHKPATSPPEPELANAGELVPGPLGPDVANVNAHESLRLLGFSGLHQVHQLNVLHGHLAQLAGGNQRGQAEQAGVRTKLGNE